MLAKKGIELGCIPVYQAELVPAEVRGFAVGSYQMSYGVGNLLMASKRATWRSRGRDVSGY